MPRRRRKHSRGRLRRFFDIALTLVILGLGALVSARLDRVAEQELAGSAIVNDGDSITIGSQRIRLRGIDAPELSQTCRRGGADYACGRASRDALAALVRGRTVSCTGWERDRYERLLAVCTAGGRDLNRSQVEAGWAVAYGDYRDLEDDARRQRSGLWAGTFERPQEWRVRHGGLLEDEHGAMRRALNWLTQLFRFG